MAERPVVAPWKTWSALGVVYVVWGSTYLAIRYTVDGLPPLLAASTRFFVSAAILSAFVLVRRGWAAFGGSGRQWAGAAGVGVLLLAGGNGGVMLAEGAHLPSGLTALLVAGVPLFVVAVRLGTGDRPPAGTLVGVGVGLLGLAVLLLPGARPHGVAWGAAALVVSGSVLWAVGSVLATRIDLPSDPIVTTVVQMLGGAAGLGLLGVARSERLRLGAVHASAWLALAYLVVFGAVLAFTAYSWLLQTAPVSQAATYAYVNPVVAVVLGAVVAGEHVSATSLVGGTCTVAAVFLVVRQESGGASRPYGPTERQGRLRSSAT